MQLIGTCNILEVCSIHNHALYLSSTPKTLLTHSCLFVNHITSLNLLTYAFT